MNTACRVHLADLSTWLLMDTTCWVHLADPPIWLLGAFSIDVGHLLDRIIAFNLVLKRNLFCMVDGYPLLDYLCGILDRRRPDREFGKGFLLRFAEGYLGLRSTLCG